MTGFMMGNLLGTSRLVFARLHLDTGDVHLAEDLLQETLLRASGEIA